MGALTLLSFLSVFPLIPHCSEKLMATFKPQMNITGETAGEAGGVPIVARLVFTL